MSTIPYAFTPIPDAVLDALLQAELTKREWSVVMAVARLTWGKGADAMVPIGNGIICDMTGLGRPHVASTLKGLQARQIILVDAGKRHPLRGVNADPSLWISRNRSKTDRPAPIQNRSANDPKQIENRSKTETALDIDRKRRRAPANRLGEIKAILVNEFHWHFNELDRDVRSIQMLAGWASDGTTDEDIRLACQAAHATLGERPGHASYYHHQIEKLKRGSTNEASRRDRPSASERFDEMLKPHHDHEEALEGCYSRD